MIELANYGVHPFDDGVMYLVEKGRIQNAIGLLDAPKYKMGTRAPSYHRIDLDLIDPPEGFTYNLPDRIIEYMKPKEKDPLAPILFVKEDPKVRQLVAQCCQMLNPIEPVFIPLWGLTDAKLRAMANSSNIGRFAIWDVQTKEQLRKIVNVFSYSIANVLIIGDTEMPIEKTLNVKKIMNPRVPHLNSEQMDRYNWVALGSQVVRENMLEWQNS